MPRISLVWIEPGSPETPCAINKATKAVSGLAKQSRLFTFLAGAADALQHATSRRAAQIVKSGEDEPTATPSAPRAMTFARAIARRPLSRLTVELGLVILAKLAFLMLIWWLIFAPHPKPDASAAAIARRLAPSTNPPEAHP